MKTLYLDCGMGAAGDMLAAALYGLLSKEEQAEFLREMNEAGIPGTEIRAEDAEKCGIVGIHMNVAVHGEEERSEDVDLTVQRDEIHGEVHGHEHDHDHEHDHGHDHEHSHDHDHDHGHGHGHDHEHDHEHEQDHGHDHEHEHDHEHDHKHDHEHGHDHDHEHGHDHDHGHEHGHDHDHDHEHDHNQEHDHDHDHGHDHGHDHAHHHHHASMEDIRGIIASLKLPEESKVHILAVYSLIALAESSAHGRPVSEIHFHEVGTMDAIADIAAVCLLMQKLAPEKVLVSPVHVGSGRVRCAHGILPVPTPATAHILQGVPIYGGGIQGELCTPTGAALLKHFATAFGDMPPMVVEKIGYGMGKKDFPVANCLRAMLGDSFDDTQQVVELSCNMDDMTAERIAFATEMLMAKGALEAFTVPVGMKKSRPGMLLTVVCTEAKRDEMVRLIFKHTTTIGVRENISHRFTLKRRMYEKESEFGPVRVKHSEGYGVVREKYEYEDLAAIARARDLSIEEVVKLLS